MHGINVWASLSLEEIVPALEEGLLLPLSIAEMLCILHKFKNEREPSHVLRLHAYARKNGWEAHKLIGNELVSTLAYIGTMHAAQEMFEHIGVHHLGMQC